jgi:pimeloyl-ACP methyl ester carboxylesterase
MGGALALELAKRGVAKSVVAIAPGGGWTEGDGEARRVGKFFAAQTKRTRASAKWLPQIMRRGLTRKIAMRDAMRHGELMAPVDAVDLAMSALKCTVTDRVLDALMVDRGVAMSGLDQIECPVLLASPQFDRILPATKHAQRFRREIPGIESMTMPGCGHLPMWDDTALVVNTIVEFVERQRSAESPSLAASPSPVG